MLKRYYYNSDNVAVLFLMRHVSNLLEKANGRCRNGKQKDIYDSIIARYNQEANSRKIYPLCKGKNLNVAV